MVTRPGLATFFVCKLYFLQFYTFSSHCSFVHPRSRPLVKSRGGRVDKGGVKAVVADDMHGIESALRGLAHGPGRAVLIVDPGPDQQAKVARLLAVLGHRAIGTSSLDGALALLRAFPVDLVLLAEEVAGDAPLRVVAELVGQRPHARVVIVTPPDGPHDAADRPHGSTLEYVPRPFDRATLAALLPS
jgi:CheY-like chemotaxis protein